MFTTVSYMFNLFKTKKQQKINNDICSINLTLSQNGIITTELFWPNFNKDNYSLMKKISENFAALLYLLMNGSMNKDIFSTMDEVKDNPKSSSYDKEFVKLLDDHILFLKKMDISSVIDSTAPVIAPSMVFKNAHAK